MRKLHIALRVVDAQRCPTVSWPSLHIRYNVECDLDPAGLGSKSHSTLADPWEAVPCSPSRDYSASIRAAPSSDIALAAVRLMRHILSQIPKTHSPSSW